MLENEQINQLRYLPPRIDVYGNQFKKKDVSKGGVRTQEFEIDKYRNRIRVPYEDKEKRELPEKWQGLCTKT